MAARHVKGSVSLGSDPPTIPMPVVPTMGPLAVDQILKNARVVVSAGERQWQVSPQRLIAARAARGRRIRRPNRIVASNKRYATGWRQVLGAFCMVSLVAWPLLGLHSIWGPILAFGGFCIDLGAVTLLVSIGRHRAIDKVLREVDDTHITYRRAYNARHAKETK
jgi:hypothetical protein